MPSASTTSFLVFQSLNMVLRCFHLFIIFFFFFNFFSLGQGIRKLTETELELRRKGKICTLDNAIVLARIFITSCFLSFKWSVAIKGLYFFVGGRSTKIIRKCYDSGGVSATGILHWTE